MVTGKTAVGEKLSQQTALTARLMLYGLMAVVLMAMDHRGQYVPRFRQLANHIVEPVYHVVEWPVRALREVFGFVRSAQSLRRENDAFRRELLSKEAELQRLEDLIGENVRLRALLDHTGAQQFAFQFAELVDVDLDPFSHRVIIDRGEDRHVVVGQAVIDGAGVMGQVEAVNEHFSTVRLISDPNHALPVQINRTGLRTVAFGLGTTAELSLPSVPREADVREGDLIVTSGLGERFPRGYPVATVTSIDRREGQTFALVLAAPLAALDRGREVLLVMPLESVEEAPVAEEIQPAESDLESEAAVGLTPAESAPGSEPAEETTSADPGPEPETIEETAPAESDAEVESAPPEAGDQP